ncbi:MAG TPA: PhzF family phenazine biosynthesis protein [Xanthobacteraceae bacterium]|jgi:trans-2,3-dihydro-3-hydroxyanthranilate isomerase|nr:PhzF family phenazine biosynthesis protein [Xanthobacteraceae bacterium]
MRRKFFTLDVFTRRRYAGNPLAVVLDAGGLDGAAMQSIAREFNLSETVFVLPPADAAHRAKLRIFTPKFELAFAGHPTVGSAVLLNRIDGAKGKRTIVLEEGVGPVRCAVEAVDAETGSARFDLARLPAETGPVGPPAAIAAALNLNEVDIGLESFKPGRWSAGNEFNFAPLTGLDAMRRCRANTAVWNDAFPDQGGRASAFLFCRETVERGHAFHARMFAPLAGIIEDPATGSAVAAFAGVLAHFARPADGTHDFVIEQGYEMGRQSLIHLAMTMKGGKLTAAAIAGEAVVVSEGTLEA